MIAWLAMTAAIAFEVIGTTLLKQSAGFGRVGIGGASLVAYWICFVFLAIALKSIPVGVAYAVWSGVGTALIVLIGVVAFDERLSALQILFILLIVVGAVGLNLVTEIREP